MINKTILSLTIIALVATMGGFCAPQARAIEKLQASDLQIYDVTGESATISWKTNRLADGWVEYGTDTNFTNYVKITGPLRQHHEATLGGLKGQTTYYFRIKSIDAYGQEIISFGSTFLTGIQVDTTKPEISKIKIEYVTDTTAVVSWYTDEYATSGVYYSYQTDGAQFRWLAVGGNGTYHVVVLSGLQPMTYYHLQVESADSSVNISRSTLKKFSTTAQSEARTTPLQILDLKPLAPGDTPITHDTAIIDWRINKFGIGQVHYGATPALGAVIQGPEYDSHFRIMIKSLVPSTTYYYKVYSQDIFGHGAWSNEMRFTTQPKPEPLPELRVPQVLGATLGYEYTKSTDLFKSATSPSVYAIFSNKKYLISSPSVFEEFGYDWSDVKVVSDDVINRIPSVRLVKGPSDPTIYYLYLEKGIKKAVTSPSVFNSYQHNRWEDIITVPAQDLNRFSDARLIKTRLSSTVYKVEGNAKRPVKNVAAFEKNNFSWSEICSVNQADVDSYYTGEFVE